MGHEILVEEVIEEGRRLIERIADEALTVVVAAWIKKLELRTWAIYIGASSASLDIKKESGRIVLRALARIVDPTISLFYIDLIEASDPVVDALLALRDRYPTMVARKLKTKRAIGHLDTRGLYLYPPNFTLTDPNEVVHSVLRLLDRSGSAAPSVVTFKDGSRIHAVPVGIRLNTPEGARIDWHDVVTSQDRSVSARDVVSIL